MTRKDYILLAEALRDKRQGLDVASVPNPERLSAMYESFWDTIDHICGALYQDNPRFNRDHFLAVVRGEKPLDSRPSRKAVL